MGTAQNMSQSTLGTREAQCGWRENRTRLRALNALVGNNDLIRLTLESS